MLTTQFKSILARKAFGPLMITLIFTCLLSTAAFAQTAQTTNVEVGTYMVGYYTGANQGLPDAQMHIVNPGSTGGYGNSDERPSGIPQGGDLCANIYVFTSDEQMIACCSCKVSPNGMQGFSLATDLVGKPLTSLVPRAGAVKVVTSQGGGREGSLNPPPPGPKGADSGRTTGRACSASSEYYPEGQLQTWLTHVRALGAAFGASHAVTEIPFQGAYLSESEVQKLQSQCFGIEASEGHGGVGSGAGKCTCDPLKTI
jgi:hypothetical protein